MPGTIHALDTGREDIRIVFASEQGTGSHAVSGWTGVVHFIQKTLGHKMTDEDLVLLKNDKGLVGVDVSDLLYQDYFSKNG